MKTGIEIIADERQRQIVDKGWSREHDSQHPAGALADAAACYAVAGSAGTRGADASEEFTASMLGGYNDSLLEWPFEDEDWKPASDPLRNLAKAGALIAAEMDRILAERARAANP